MKLTRLDISGFKSFAEAVELPFDEGMTAIVGPNGCGKSNISDAVRWVLGEQRARLLRGARMEDVIFHGAAKHRPVNVAEVSLHFENSDGALPIAFGEVVITRRLSRSGASDYLINQAPVRLRDVQDLLRGTGLGSDAGVVIEAQMIDRLLSDKAEERRSLFEEAAGIGLYRDRKTSTERQLEHTAEDLQRLDDILSEVQREVRSLARQRGKAERHRKIRDERFAIVMTLTRHDLEAFADRVARLDALRAELAEHLPQARETMQLRERERESASEARATAEARRTELERRLSQAKLDVGRLQGDLNVAAERLRHAADRRERALAERQQADERAQQAARDRDAAAAERVAAEQARASVQTELDLRTATEEEARRRLVEARSRVRHGEETLQERAEGWRELAGERTALERDIEELRRQEAEASAALAAARTEREAAAQHRAAAEAEIARRDEAVLSANAALEHARHGLASVRERESAVRTERRAAEEALARLGARRGALERLERDRVGLAPAARQLLEARAQFGDGAVLGPLSDFVQTERGDAPLAERLFGEWLHAVLVRDEAVEAVRRWHRAQQPGPLVLLPASGPVGGENGDGGPIVPLTATGPAGAWVQMLLAGHAVLEGGRDAVRRPNGAVVLLGGEADGGPLARRADLETLKREIAEAEKRLQELEAAVERAAQAHAAAEAGLAEASAFAERARTALREAQGTADDAARIFQRAVREQQEAEDAAGRLSERLQHHDGRLAELAAALATADEERERLETALAQDRTTLAELESAQEAARERRVHWQIEEAQVSAREQAAAERESRGQAALDAARDAMTRLETELATLEDDAKTSEEQAQQWRDTLAERHVTVQEVERAAGEAETAVGQAEEDLRAAERALQTDRATLAELGERTHQMELERTELDGRRNALIERVEAEWHRPLTELLESVTPIEGEPEWLREEAQRLADRLESMGPVNPLAVEEHAEETKRLEFLTAQREDLVAARARLQEALREIDETARGLFVETFAKIRENFQTVFHTLFEGGECDVRLINESDPLSSEIEIFAAPRGKRTQRIHLLSSGERALVAISLLFAIYLTKPSPFCLLDEVDAPLDDANVVRFIQLLSEFKRDTQFIVITHNPRTMQVADAVYGVTMQEPGVSTIVGVRLGEAERI